MTSLPLEADVLEAFWNACRENRGNRLELLQDVERVRVRPIRGRTPGQVRAAFIAAPRQPFPETGCFACYTRHRKMAWHHIVTVEHGGGNNPWNLVPLCHVCHRRIHPWMDEEPGEWTSTADMVTQLLDGLKQRNDKESA